MTLARPLQIAWGLYAWLAFSISVLLSVFVVLFVPGLERRRRWVTRFARLPFRVAAVPTSVHGLSRLPDEQCVVVANHASYVDGVLLQAFLPPRFSYVIKGEMARVPLASLLLRRIGSRFVERAEQSGKVRDARALVRATHAGESLAWFPEGTFIGEPGLGRFRPGAFAAAARAGVPVVPVVISGSRYLLPERHVLPRRGPIRIDILEPIPPSDPAFGDHRQLADIARQRILAVLDEPDLAPETAGDD